MNKKDPQRISKIAKEVLLSQGLKSIGVDDHSLIKEVYKKSGYKEKATFSTMSVTVLNRLSAESKRENPLFTLEWIKKKKLCRNFILIANEKQ